MNSNNSSQRRPNCLLQIWNDYQRGRALRKEDEQKRLAPPPAKPPTPSPTPPPPTPNTAAGGPQANTVPHRAEGRPRWRRVEGQYPWRITKTIADHSNWRGTWVLEVRDIFALDWNAEDTGGSQAQPHLPHWPFPYARRDRAARRKSGAKRNETEDEEDEEEGEAADQE